jgi:type III pantothenate kinase
MRPFFVADIGNTRIKCGFYKDDRLHGFVILDDAIRDWKLFLENCEEIASASRKELLTWPWLVAAVKPAMCEHFVSGVRSLGFSVRVLSDYREIPLQVDVDAPERVGIDRLLCAVAVARRMSVGIAAAVISAGTAVTVDLVDANATFRGGVILPGFRMMAQSLHEKTALLPLVEEIEPRAAVPARNTESAIGSGIVAAISGGVDRVIEQYRWTEPSLGVFLTGGDADLVELRYCKPTTQPVLALLGLTVVASGAK